MKPMEETFKIDQQYVAYFGRAKDGCVTVQRIHRSYGTAYELKPRLDLRNHSPTGFAWGYGGSGPAQLSLAILADYFNDQKVGDLLACALYQDFKWHITGGLELGKDFELSGELVEGAIQAIFKSNSGRREDIEGLLEAAAFDDYLAQNDENFSPSNVEARMKEIHEAYRAKAEELLKIPFRDPDQAEREKRLRELTGMIEVTLGPEWVYFVVIAKPGEPQSINLVSNAPEEIAADMIREIGERWNKGTRPQKL